MRARAGAPLLPRRSLRSRRAVGSPCMVHPERARQPRSSLRAAGLADAESAPRTIDVDDEAPAGR